MRNKIKSLLAEQQKNLVDKMKKETDEEKKIELFRNYTYDKDQEEENLARDHGLLEEFNSYKGNPSLADLLEIQKERNRLKGNKFKFNLPDELADKMRNAFMKAKKIADARVEK